MENSQSLQHQPRPVKGSKRKLAKSKSATKGSSNTLIYLLVHHPWLLLVGLLTMAVGTAAFAFYSLSHVSDEKQAEPEQLPAVIEAPIKTPSENNNPTPLWVVAAIALSCASGCFIIFRLFNRPTPRQRVQKNITDYSPASLTPSRQPQWQRVERTTPIFEPLQPMKPIPIMQAKEKPVVTVLPPDETHSREKGKESLADLMDLRKDNSLSAILQKF